MVTGQYYYVWSDNCSGFMVGKCLGNIKIDNQYYRCNAILISTLDDNKAFQKTGWCYKSPERYYRNATKEEIEWLELCISEGKFIEKPKQINYELW